MMFGHQVDVGRVRLALLPHRFKDPRALRLDLIFLHVSRQLDLPYRSALRVLRLLHFQFATFGVPLIRRVLVLIQYLCTSSGY